MKRRHRVLGLLSALSILTFLDRMAIAVTGPAIQSDLHISTVEWGWVLSGYVLANGLFEIPSGVMGDRHGQRVELTRIVTWWSAFTTLTAWCHRFWQLAAARFFFGMGSAGAYPNAAGAISRWFPARERARSQGTLWAASRLGGVLAPLLIVPLQYLFGWRAVFFLLGVLGFVWAVVWHRLYRDRPEEDPGLSAEERAEIEDGGVRERAGAVPFQRALRSRALWMVVLAYGCYGCCSWFYFSWFPAWFLHKTGLPLEGMLLTSLPFALGIAGNLAGGVLSDRLAARWGAKRALRLIPGVCLTGTAVVIVAMTLCHGVLCVLVLSSVGFGAMDLMLPSAWAMCVAIGGRASGTATGMMNTAGQAGGFFCTILFGYIVQLTGNYNLPLWLIAGMVVTSAAIFASIDCTQRIDADLAAC